MLFHSRQQSRQCRPASQAVRPLQARQTALTDRAAIPIDANLERQDMLPPNAYCAITRLRLRSEVSHTAQSSSSCRLTTPARRPQLSPSLLNARSPRIDNATCSRISVRLFLNGALTMPNRVPNRAARRGSLDRRGCSGPGVTDGVPRGTAAGRPGPARQLRRPGDRRGPSCPRVRAGGTRAGRHRARRHTPARPDSLLQ